MSKRTDLDILESLHEVDRYYSHRFNDFEIDFMESMMTKLKCDVDGLTDRQREKALEIEEKYLGAREEDRFLDSFSVDD